MSTLSASPTDMAHPGYAAGTVKAKICIAGQPDPSTTHLTALLQAGNPGYEVACLNPGSTQINHLLEEQPDALLIQNDYLDKRPDFSIVSILRHYPGLRVIVYGRQMDDEHLYRLIQSGAHGYIHERMDETDIQRALDTVIGGDTWIEQHLLARFEPDHDGRDVGMQRLAAEKIERLRERLTRREKEILAQVMQGLAIKQIAQEVHLSHQGVKMHLAKLFRKFNVSNRNQLILAALDAVSPLDNLSGLLSRELRKDDDRAS
jgi:DNA-binding NarL/FixJ family response regulator